jgi:hypothetical protein
MINFNISKIQFRAKVYYVYFLPWKLQFQSFLLDFVEWLNWYGNLRLLETMVMMGWLNEPDLFLITLNWIYLLFESLIWILLILLEIFNSSEKLIFQKLQINTQLNLIARNQYSRTRFILILLERARISSRTEKLSLQQKRRNKLCQRNMQNVLSCSLFLKQC